MSQCVHWEEPRQLSEQRLSLQVKLNFTCKQELFDHELPRTTKMEGFNTISPAAFKKSLMYYYLRSTVKS